jgi:hypothetical protein
MRAMLCSIGWALGQITIGILSLFLVNWRIIFLIALIPLAVRLYLAYIKILDPQQGSRSPSTGTKAQGGKVDH